jgi:RNA polymerase sigma-70 factor (ECF subfamily)
MAEDTKLYDDWQAGDPEAGQALVERYYDPILRFFLTKVGVQADELVQRTFTECASGSFSGQSSFRAYLFGLARSTLLEHFRSRPDSDPELDVREASCFELESGPSAIAAKSAEQRLLFEALRRVPLDVQMTLELTYWEGLSPAEIAVVFAVPETTIQSRLHRGRALLREALDELPATPDEHKSVSVLLGTWSNRT